MELRESHLRYLLTIYELGQQQETVGTADIAKALGYAKASVSNMVTVLMDMGLLERKRYGKIFLTETGYQHIDELLACAAAIQLRLSALEPILSAEEVKTASMLLASHLSESSRRKLASCMP